MFFFTRSSKFCMCSSLSWTIQYKLFVKLDFCNSLSWQTVSKAFYCINDINLRAIFNVGYQKRSQHRQICQLRPANKETMMFNCNVTLINYKNLICQCRLKNICHYRNNGNSSVVLYILMNISTIWKVLLWVLLLCTKFALRIIQNHASNPELYVSQWKAKWTDTRQSTGLNALFTGTMSAYCFADTVKESPRPVLLVRWFMGFGF